MRIKARPEDFIVKEILPHDFIKTKGRFKVFALIKRKATTHECLRVIAQHFKLKFSDIGYCGLKDKHAQTIQYITLPRGEEFKTLKFKIRFVGYSSKHLRRGDHLGNEFTITIKVSEEEKELIKLNEPRVNEGFINLFGKQRTGHEIIPKSFTYFALKGDYETALLRYYINKSKYAGKRLKKAYKECFKHWPDMKKCYSILKGLEKNITLRPLREKDYLTAIKKIPKTELELLVAGYQALVWNQDPQPELPVIKLPFLKTRGGKREVMVKPQDLMINYGDKEVILKFKLPKGSFATVLIDELLRKNL